jgi:hypothetical protein
MYAGQAPGDMTDRHQPYVDGLEKQFPQFITDRTVRAVKGERKSLTRSGRWLSAMKLFRQKNIGNIPNSTYQIAT